MFEINSFHKLPVQQEKTHDDIVIIQPVGWRAVKMILLTRIILMNFISKLHGGKSLFQFRFNPEFNIFNCDQVLKHRFKIYVFLLTFPNEICVKSE